MYVNAFDNFFKTATILLWARYSLVFTHVKHLKFKWLLAQPITCPFVNLMCGGRCFWTIYIFHLGTSTFIPFTWLLCTVAYVFDAIYDKTILLFIYFFKSQPHRFSSKPLCMNIRCLVSTRYVMMCFSTEYTEWTIYLRLFFQSINDPRRNINSWIDVRNPLILEL